MVAQVWQNDYKVDRIMIEHKHTLRVQYPDTDKMGTVHHSNYAKYYETARWELFRSIGISYSSIEQAGYLLPVIEMKTKFYKTTYYDAELTVITKIVGMKGPRIFFESTLYNQENELLNSCDIELAFVKKDTWKPCSAPLFVLEILQKYV